MKKMIFSRTVLALALMGCAAPMRAESRVEKVKTAAKKQIHESIDRLKRCIKRDCSRMEALKAARDVIIALGPLFAIGAGVKEAREANKRNQTELDLNLIAAAAKGQVDDVRWLLRHGADVNATHETFKGKQGVSDDYGIEWTATALIWAARNGHTKVIEALIDENADVDAKDSSGWTALIWAAKNGHTKAVKALLAAKADVNAKDDTRGWTALMWAARNGYTKVVKALVENGADVHAEDKFKWTALMRAAYYGHTAIVEFLKEAGASEEYEKCDFCAEWEDYRRQYR